MGDGSGDEVMDDRASYQGTSEEEEINEEGSSDEEDSSGNSDDNEGVINEVKEDDTGHDSGDDVADNEFFEIGADDMPMPPQDEGGMPQDEDDNNVDGEDNIVVCMSCNNDDNDDDMKMPAVSSSFVNVEQEFTGGNGGTKYTATLLAENGVEFNKNNKKKKKERSCMRKYRCRGYQFGIDCCCGTAFGANQWHIEKKSEGRRSRRSKKDQGTTIFACALFAKKNGLNSIASSKVGQMVPCKNIKRKEHPVMVPTRIESIENNGQKVDSSVLLYGGDVGLVDVAVKAGLKVQYHGMGDGKVLSEWIKDMEVNGSVYEGEPLGEPLGLFVNSTEARGSLNFSSGIGQNSKFHDMMKENLKSHPHLNLYMEKIGEFNNITSCWMNHYVREQSEQDDKPVGSKRKSAPKGGYKRQGSKKVKTSKQGGRKKGRGKRKRRGDKKWGRHRLHADGQYCGMRRAILSFATDYKIMRIEDRETGRWFDILVQHGTVVDMSRQIGGVSDKRWMHSVRNAQGSYTLAIEYSPKKN